MNIKEEAKKILNNLSIEEKIGQLTQVYITKSNLEKMKELVKAGKVGSVIVADGAFAGDGAEAVLRESIDEFQKIAACESKSKIPLMFARDVIHGHKVVYPIPLAMSASFNFDLVGRAYQCIAEEALCDGINWTYTPMLDMSRDPRWGRVIEGPGEDPYLGGKMAEAIVKGIQGEEYPYQMAACAKHYIGYGASEGGRDYHKSEISDYSLRNYYTTAFKKAADADVLTVMSSFNEISGQPVTSSSYLLKNVLRDELGFDGFVVSDWGSIPQLINQGVADNKKDAAMLSINAGVDVDLSTNCYMQYLDELTAEGKVSLETIEEAALRVIEVKLKLGLFENPYSSYKSFDKEKHMEIAREIAAESIVLLKNNNNVLPLDKDERIGLTGPFLNDKRSLLGSWTLDFDIDYVTTIGDAIKNVAPNTVELADIKKRELCDCDTVIAVLGEYFGVTGEAHSVADISLETGQVECIRKLKKLGKKVVAVITAGRPLALGEIENEADAVLYVWHGGTQTGLATADVLFGDVCPSGKLPMTFPRVTGQIPIYYNCPPAARNCNGYYGDETPITNYEDVISTPLYPFGYGLSYGKFEYSDITTEKEKFTTDELKKGIKVSVKLSNIGKCDAKETVQLYVRDITASYTRPLKELKGISKVFVKSKNTVKVDFVITDEMLDFYTPNGDFVTEKGDFDIFIGSDSYTENKVTVTLL